MINIILCGGNGTRLWPISRTYMPKQFVKSFNDRSLFQLTAERNNKLCDSLFIVSNSEQYFLAVDQLEELQLLKGEYLLEPVGRNTAPAIALACFAMDPETIVLVTPSDHLIKNEDEYFDVINRGRVLATKGGLVTFGVEPKFAETGFGYIETENKGSENVKAFHEKPTLDVANKYVAAGNYYWNSGMFMFKAGVYLKELESHSPEIYTASLNAFKLSNQKNSLIRVDHDSMMNIPEDSIDYAVMEKSEHVKVVPANIEWNDIGSFDALYEELPKDINKNTDNENHISINSSNNLIYGSDRKIATIDMNNIIVVDTGDAVLISKRGSSQKVKLVVEELKHSGSELHCKHVTTYRSWGSYTVLEDSPGYKIKKIEVKPGKHLSMQKHYHRNEHWIVLLGTATVTVGNERKIIRPNESTYIRMGEAHQLSNEGKIPVVLIEAQVGEYINEDDIVVFDE